MRKIYPLLSLLILFSSFNPVLSQWQIQSNTYGEFSSIAGNSKIILAATNYNLFYSENHGGDWKNQSGFQGYKNYLFRKGDTFFVQKGSEFLVSTDGKTWQKKTGYGYLMAADEYTLLGVAENKIYSSSNDGNSWQLLPFTLPRYTNIQSLAIAGNSIYVATSEGLYQSKDKGQTWRQLQNLLYDILSVSALGMDVLLATRYHGLFYSIDSGSTWTNIDYYSNSVITDSQFLSTYLTDNKFIIGSLYSGRIYLSEDKGKTWKNISAGLPTNVGVDNITIVDDKIFINTVESFNGVIWQRSTAEFADDFLLAPTSLTADAYSRDQTLLKWIDNASNEIGFKIERSITDADHFVEIGNVPKDSTTFKDNDVVNGQTYFYRVRAYNQITHSTYSNQIKLRRLPTTCEDYVTASSNALFDVFFVSSTKGFSVGEFGKLLKTEDGGQNWQDVKHCTYSSYSKIKFTSTSVGYATGSWGSMMKTTDGGENWQRLQPPTSRDIRDLFFLNDSIGFILGENVYKTTDGAISWEKQYISWDELYSIFFTSETTGFVCGRSNTLYKTTDSGKNWKAIDLNFLGFNIGVHSIYFVNNSIGFIGGDGFIAKTLDGGDTWTRVEPTNSFPYVNDIFFQDANTGFVSSGFNGGAVYKTNNGGQTWETVYLGGTPFGIHFNGNTGCVVGEIDAGSTTYFGRTLSITKDGGNSWTAISNAGYDSYSNVSFISDKVGFLSHWPNAYTGNNNYFKTIDGGENWLEQQTNIEGDYNYIKFFDERNGVMVGDAVLRTEDGGQSWTKYTHDIGHYGLIRELDFVDENLWFLCTYTDGLIYRTTDGGKNFIKISKIDNTLISLNFINSQIGFAGSLFGKIYKTTDGGLTWKIVFDDYVTNNYTGIFSFDFVNETVGYASGTKGAIYKTEDGGNSWQYLQGEFVGFSQRDLVNFRKIDFYDENIGYVASYNPGLSRLYKTNDGGKTWFDVQTYDNESFWAFHFFDANKALIAGGDGLILKLESNSLPCKPNLFTNPVLEVCANKDYQYSVTNYNNLSYKWNIFGGSITSIDRNTAIVQWNQVGNQRLSVNMTNDCGTGEALNFDVMVSDLPITPTISRQNDSTLVSSSLTGNQWLLNGQAIAGETKQVLTIKQIGIYSLQVSNFCGSIVSDTVKIEVITGINKEVDDRIKIFPNPADGQVNIQLEGNNADVSIEMLNTMGTSLYRTHIYSNSHSFSTNGITPGLYIIKISTPQKTYVRKVLIK